MGGVSKIFFLTFSDQLINLISFILFFFEKCPGFIRNDRIV